jgi:dCTP deaminase
VILSDRDLRKAQAEHSIVAPFVDGHVQPASIDLTLGSEFIVWHGTLGWGEYGPIEPFAVTRADGINIEPGQFLLGATVETVTTPNHLVGLIDGRSSWARLGIAVHITAGYIDPGFHGQITLELKNVGHKAVHLPVGARICQLRLTQLTSPAERPYGSPGLGSHYQGQTGVTASAIGEPA